MFIFICVFRCIHVHVCVCIYVCIYIYICVCMCIYIYIERERERESEILLTIDSEARGNTRVSSVLARSLTASPLVRLHCDYSYNSN